MSPNASLNGIFSVLQDGEKWLIYLKLFSCDSPIRHTDGQADDSYRRQGNALQFAEFGRLKLERPVGNANARYPIVLSMYSGRQQPFSKTLLTVSPARHFVDFFLKSKFNRSTLRLPRPTDPFGVYCFDCT